MAKIGITSQTFRRRYDLRLLAETGLAGHELSFAPVSALPTEMSAVELRAFLFSKDGALVGRETIDDDLLAAVPTLKAIGLYGVGHDNIDLDACKRRGVSVYIASGVNAQAVAEHTLGLMLSVLHNISLTDRLLRDGVWHKDGGRQLAGKTVGIVGVGAVGTRVARLARAFGCHVLLTDICSRAELAKEIGAFEAPLVTSRESADILTVHVPLTAVTRGFFDDQAFAAMKKGAILINTSRGAVVSLAALKKALSSGQLAGAGLDVYENEPILGGAAMHPELFAHAGVVATPHIAGNAMEAVQAMGQAAVDALRGHFSAR